MLHEPPKLLEVVAQVQREASAVVAEAPEMTGSWLWVYNREFAAGGD